MVFLFLTFRTDEIKALEVSGSDLSPFYQQLKGVKDHHRRLPINAPAVDSLEISSILDKARVSAGNLANMFSGEESLGRFLDLNGAFEEALAVMGSEAVTEKKFDYLAFLRTFADPKSYIPESKQSTAAYIAFLDSLLSYLNDFMARSRPLSPPVEFFASEALAALKAQFDAEEASLNSNDNTNESDLYCRACQKLFSNPAVFTNHLTGKKHIKAQESLKDGEEDPSALSEAKKRLIAQKRAELQRKHSIARRELLLSTLGGLLQSVASATLGNVERRQALTPEERASLDAEAIEEDAEEENEEESSTDLDGRIYNPLKLPLDWDGKPIPFWLWKLHGLGVPFPCEICGNFVYMGRRAFDQHFFEWRHSHGMKCLGIPNTKHFFQITSIEEAKRLWEKMRDAAKAEVFHPELQEECEDAAGNVYERRTFEDLKRQGLL